MPMLAYCRNAQRYCGAFNARHGLNRNAGTKMVKAKRMKMAASAAALLLGITVAYAQQEGEQRSEQNRQQKEQDAGQREGQAGRSQEGQQGQDAKLDHALAAWLIIGNQGEVQISQLGQERGENERVKEFSQTAIKDHTAFIEKLQQAAGGQEHGQRGADAERSNDTQNARNRSGGTAGQNAQGSEAQGKAAGQEQNEAQQQAGQRAGGQSGERSRTQSAQGEERDRSAQFRAAAGGMHGQMSQLLQIKQELGDRHVESCREELSQKQGAEFDKAYMTKQVALHQEMLDTLQVFSNHASPELQQVLEQGQQTTQQHLAMAKEILQTVEQGQTR